MALVRGDAERFVKEGFRAFAVVLLHGDDAGLVHERARGIARASVEDPADPFQLLRFEGDALAAEPQRLAEEADTLPMLGGTRAIWLRAGARPLEPALRPLLERPPPARVVIEAGELRKDAQLRTLLEPHPRAAVLACYADAPERLGGLVDAVAAEHGLAVDADARAALVEGLGADRMLSRAEVEKVAMHALGTGRITVADVEAVASDASAHDLDDAVDAAFAGEGAGVERAASRLIAEGQDAGQLANAALRHALALRGARARADGGERLGEAAARMRARAPRRPVVEAQLRAWGVDALDRAIGLLAEAVAKARRHPRAAEGLALRALWSVAALRRGGGRP